MSKKNIDEMLENEIGEFGGDIEQSTQLGKLRNKSSYGQKEDLNDDEQASLNRFLNKSKEVKEEHTT